MVDRGKPGWEDLPDEQLMQLRIRDLGLKIRHSPLEPFIGQLYGELDARGIRYHPPCYLADEWFCPNKVPVIAVPFCLAHPRLKHIEMRMMYEVEGGTPKTCMKLLRHECGHALNYAYLFYRRTRWREVFGPFSAPYSTSYRFQPYSRRFVLHLQDNYAQAHPDEDFAETFAVWLDPESRWETKYQDWPVIRKLRYVDRLMRAAGEQAPRVSAHQKTPSSADRMTSTLAAYYERKRKYLGSDFPGYYDEMLRRIFPATAAADGAPRASSFLRRHRRRIINSVTAWSGHRKYDIHGLVAKLVKRCDALGLRIAAPEPETLIELTALITTVANNALRMPPDRAKK